MAVQTLGKPMNQRCQHLCDTGCAIYAIRPYACRFFDCLWLQGYGLSECRPDRIHAVFTALTDGSLAVHEEADHEGEGRAALRDLIARMQAHGRTVRVWVGDDEIPA